MRRESLLLFALLAGGCAPWSRAVLGPGPGAAIGLWTEGGFRRADAHTASEWSVVDYRATEADGSLRIDDLREVASLDGAIDHVMAGEDLFLAAHEGEARAALSLPPAPPLDVTADGSLHADSVHGTHVVTSAAWIDGEVRLIVVSSIVVTAWSMPCGGAPSPSVEMVVDGVRWTRTIRLDAHGEILGVEPSEMERAPRPPACDPRVAARRHIGGGGGVNAT